MKVILTKEVPNVGQAGTVKEVSTGYARNYLLKNNLAVIATATALANWSSQQEKIKKQATKGQAELEKVAAKLSGLKLTISAKANEQGKLFAGLDAKAISAELTKKLKTEIKSDWLKLTEPIKQVGDLEVEYGVGEHTGKFKLAITAAK